MTRLHGWTVALGVAAIAMAFPAAASADVTAAEDHVEFVPILKKVIPVLRNDVGDGLHVVTHTTATYGSVDCGATTCTYSPPPRTLPPDNDDVDSVPAADRNDSFSYTVADSADQQATAQVTLVANKSVAHVRKGKVSSSRSCARSTKPRKPNPKHKASDTPGQGGAIVYARVVPCKTHKSPTPNNGPGITPCANCPAVPLAVASLNRYTGGWSARCSYTGGMFDTGEFDVREWLGENGSTGVNRFTIRFRKQAYGESIFGGYTWSTVEAASWSANYSYPDSWNSWFPASGTHKWIYGWGTEDLVEGYSAWRMQARVQWIHRRSIGPDRKIVDPGWITRCQGVPHVPR